MDAVRWWALASILALWQPCANAIPQWSSWSPDNGLAATVVRDGSGNVVISLRRNNRLLLTTQLAWGTARKSLPASIQGQVGESSPVTESWRSSVGINAGETIDSSFRGLTVPLLVRGMGRVDTEIRLYDDGMAMRSTFYAIKPGFQEKVLVNLEPTTESFSAIGGNVLLNALTPNSKECKESPFWKLPQVARLSSGTWLGITESFVTGALARVTCPGVNQLLLKNDIHVVMRRRKSTVTQTSWRTFVVGDSCEEVANSNLVLSLNPPPESVISRVNGKPMNAAYYAEFMPWSQALTTWEFRVRGAPRGINKKYGLDFESQVELMNFASSARIPYHTVDADWWGRPSALPYGLSRGFIPALVKHGSSLNPPVHIFLYMHDYLLPSSTNGLRRIYRMYKAWGVAGIKHGFMHEGFFTDRSRFRKMMLRFRDVVQVCAEERLLLFVHETPFSSGWERTFPNLVSNELATSLYDGPSNIPLSTKEIAGWSLLGRLSGATDFSFGVVAIDENFQWQKVWHKVPQTVSALLAVGTLVSPGIASLCDTPANYASAGPEYLKILSAQSVRASFQYQRRRVVGSLEDKVLVYRETVNDAGLRSYLVCGLNPGTTSMLFSLNTTLFKEGTYVAFKVEDSIDASVPTTGPWRKMDMSESEIQSIARSTSPRSKYNSATYTVNIGIGEDDATRAFLTIRMVRGGGFCILFEEPTTTTHSPSLPPTTLSPTHSPSLSPTTLSPTHSPSLSPTTLSPTDLPSLSPTGSPTGAS